MKKLVCAAVVFTVGSSIFASEVPQKPAVQVNGLSASSDAIVIPAARKKIMRDGDTNSPSSSGSSPVGLDLGCYFPGEKGAGYLNRSMAPVSDRDWNMKGHDGFFR